MGGKPSELWGIKNRELKTKTVKKLRSLSPALAVNLKSPKYRPLHKWRLNLNNNTHTSLASHSCENSFVLKHECEAKDVPRIVIEI